MSDGSGEKSSGPGLLLEVRQLEQNMMLFRLCLLWVCTMNCTLPQHWEYGVSQNMDLSMPVHLIHNLTTVLCSLAQTKKKTELGFNPVSIYIHAELTSIHWSLTTCNSEYVAVQPQTSFTLQTGRNNKHLYCLLIKIRLFHWCSYTLTEGNPGPKPKLGKPSVKWQAEWPGYNCITPKYKMDIT